MIRNTRKECIAAFQDTYGHHYVPCVGDCGYILHNQRGIGHMCATCSYQIREESKNKMAKTCIQLVSGFACGAAVQKGEMRCPEHVAYHNAKREVTLTLDESAGVYRCTSLNCSHDFSPYFGRDFCDVRDIRYTVQRLENLGFRVTLVETSDVDSLNPHLVVWESAES
jgi:hypothetical protein